MRLASLIQKPIHGPTSTDAKTIFKLATIEGAKSLHLDDQIGSIEKGKKADLVLMDLNTCSNSLLNNDENIYSDIVYASNKENVCHVMINGNWCVKDRKSEIYDEKHIIKEAKNELKELLKRVN